MPRARLIWQCTAQGPDGGGWVLLGWGDPTLGHPHKIVPGAGHRADPIVPLSFLYAA